jgi:hypothetical protein
VLPCSRSCWHPVLHLICQHQHPVHSTHHQQSAIVCNGVCLVTQLQVGLFTARVPSTTTTCQAICMSMSVAVAVCNSGLRSSPALSLLSWSRASMLRLMLATTTAGSAGPTATSGACTTHNVTVQRPTVWPPEGLLLTALSAGCMPLTHCVTPKLWPATIGHWC